MPDPLSRTSTVFPMPTEKVRKAPLTIYAPEGDHPRPVIVMERGKRRSLIAAFRPFDGVKVNRVKNSDLYTGELAEQLWAFRQDPAAFYPGKRNTEIDND